LTQTERHSLSLSLSSSLSIADDVCVCQMGFLSVFFRVLLANFETEIMGGENDENSERTKIFGLFHEMFVILLKGFCLNLGMNLTRWRELSKIQIKLMTIGQKFPLS
jgi:hypothetical protein